MKKKSAMRERREMLGLTLYELARRTGINYSTLRALENGWGENWNLKFKRTIAEALDMTGGHFFTLWPEELKKIKTIQEFVK